MKTIAIAAIILVTSVIFLGPVIFTHEWFASHTQDYYLYLMEMFKDSVDHGNWYPRWMPHLAGGYGYPMFDFYHPAFFYVTLPFTYVFTVVHAFYASLLLFTCLGAWGAYALARLYCSRAASLLAMGVFMTSHYLAGDLFGRGDLPEFAAILLCPWGMYWFIRMTDAIENRALPLYLPAAFTGVTFALSLMHPFVFLYCAPVMLCMIIGKWVESGYRLQIIAIPMLCIAIALVLSAPYWLAALQMKDMVQSHSADFITDRVHNLSEFFNDGYFTSGKLQFALAMLGWMCSLRRVFFRYMLAAHLFLIFLLTPYADAIWHMKTPLSYTQFPWRINAMLVTLQLMGCIQFLRFLSPLIARRFPRLPTPLWSMAALALVPLLVVQVTLWPLSSFEVKYREPFRIWSVLNYETYKLEAERQGFRYLVVYNEFDPVTANYKDLPNRLVNAGPVVLAHPHQQSALTMDPSSNDYVIRFTLKVDDAVGTPMEVLLNQMYMPGWQVVVNGEPALYTGAVSPRSDQPSWGLGNHGRMRLHFPTKRSYQVVAWYDGPPDWQVRNVVMILLLLILGHVLYWQIEQAKRPGESV